MLWGITIRFQKLSLSQRQVTHVLLTRPPLRYQPKSISPFDLHVLSVPPAFVLSQDQTLYLSCILRMKIIRNIDPRNHDRSQLPFDFFVFSDFSKFQIPLEFQGLFACSALFNFQDTFPRSPLLQLLYSITSAPICQVNNLWTLSGSASFSWICSFVTAYLFYHTSRRLSSK